MKKHVGVYIGKVSAPEERKCNNYKKRSVLALTQMSTQLLVAVSGSAGTVRQRSVLYKIAKGMAFAGTAARFGGCLRKMLLPAALLDFCSERTIYALS